MFIFLLVVFVTAILAVIKSFHTKSLYWKRRGIVGPPSKIFSGNLDDVTNHNYPLPLKLRDWTKKYGSVYGYFEGSKPVLVISDLEMLQELFIKKFDHFYGRKLAILIPDVDENPRVHVFDARGTRWKRLRTMASLTLSTGNLKMIKATVDDSARELVRHLEKNVDGPSFNIHEYFQEYTLDAICRVSMGQKESTQFQNEYMEDVKMMFKSDLKSKLMYLAFMFPSLRHQIRNAAILKGKLRGGLPFIKIFQKLNVVVHERIKERESDPADYTYGGRQARDYIDMFLDATVDEIHDEAEFKKQNVTVSKNLTHDEVVSQCMIFLIAGFDTTANTLGFITHELANNPLVMKKIQEELDQVIIGEDISTEDLAKLKYMDAAVKESLRLWPVASFACSRECSIPTTLGNIPVEEGIRIIADTWTIHRDKNIWGDDAEEFKPERWESSDRRHIMSWFPFGVGPRQCVGMRLALMEEKMALAHILRRFDIVHGEKPQHKLNVYGNLATYPQTVNICLKNRSI